MSRRTGATATYLYGVVHAPRAPSLAGVPPGLPGAGRPRLLPAGDVLWLVAADAPLSRYGAAAIERGLRDLAWVSACAVAHEAVVEHLARRATVVPMKLLTLFTSDERALAHIARTAGSLTRIARRVAGREEWGVRVAFDAARARAAARDPGREDAGAGSGTAFLRGKKKEQDLARELAARAPARAQEVFEALAEEADEARRRPPPRDELGARLLLDAAFLVPRGKAARFQAAAGRFAEALGPQGYTVTLTGPWPPYNFVTARGSR